MNVKHELKKNTRLRALKHFWICDQCNATFSERYLEMYGKLGSHPAIKKQDVQVF